SRRRRRPTREMSLSRWSRLNLTVFFQLASSHWTGEGARREARWPKGARCSRTPGIAQGGRPGTECGDKVLLGGVWWVKSSKVQTLVALSGQNPKRIRPRRRLGY